MRTIGQKNKNLIKMIVALEVKRHREKNDDINPNMLYNLITDKIPEYMYDIWESAASEIELLVEEEIGNALEKIYNN
jgi:hypothetical protein